jgi:hypothetical protein
MNYITKKITKSEDLAEIQQIIKKIIGETCWETRMSYGDELDLHIGDKIPYEAKCLRGKFKGSWILGSRCSDWELKLGNKVIVTSLAEDIKEQISVIENQIITDININYPELILSLKFSNGYEFSILPDLNDDSGVSCWELFTPDHKLLQIEPNYLWSYLPSNIPINYNDQLILEV